MYTRTQICGYLGISTRTFQRYRQKGIIGPPSADGGRSRYYDDVDIRRIRDARTQVLDDRLTFDGFAVRSPHPKLDPTG